MRAGIGTLIILCVGNIINCKSEYIFPELEWSSDACEDAGFASNEFELCATIEFCQGKGHFDGGDRRHLMRASGGGIRTDQSQQYRPMDKAKSFLRQVGAEGRQMQYDQYGHSYYDSYYSMENGGAEDVSDLVPSEGSFGYRIAGTKECRSPGPIIRMARGKRYGLFVNNTAAAGFIDDDTITTNLHLHGLHISGSGNADDATRKIRPGDVAVYNVTIPDYHMGGTFWYHPHYHGQTNNQVGGGAFGMLIVEDGENIGTDDTHVLEFMQNERILILDNLRSRRQTTANGIETSGYGSSGDIYHLNKDEWYRFRVLHVSADTHQSGAHIHFGDDNQCDIYPIAHDGILRFTVPRNESQNEFFLSSASRIDLAVRCSESAKIEADFMPSATIKINDDPIEPKPDATPYVSGTEQWQSTRPRYLEDLRTRVNVDISWEVQLQETSINKQQFDLKKPLCHGNGMDFAYGSLNEWTLKETNSHPFHLHMYPMQIVGDCGDEHDVGEYYDTVVVQTSDYSDRNRRCSVRLQLVDVVGHAMLHCHILQHEDQGSMGFINVVAPPSPSEDDNDEEENSSSEELIMPVQPSEPLFIYCGDESKDATTCGDEPVEFGQCIPKMPMVHTMPNHSAGGMEMDDEMEMSMQMTAEEMEKKEGYYGER